MFQQEIFSARFSTEKVPYSVFVTSPRMTKIWGRKWSSTLPYINTGLEAQNPVFPKKIWSYRLCEQKGCKPFRNSFLYITVYPFLEFLAPSPSLEPFFEMCVSLCFSCIGVTFFVQFLKLSLARIIESRFRTNGFLGHKVIFWYCFTCKVKVVVLKRKRGRQNCMYCNNVISWAEGVAEIISNN